MADGFNGSRLREDIIAIYGGAGEKAYGLYHINQLEHALQTAATAEAQGLSSAMVIACLLHDVGHMIHDLGELPAEHGVDDRHEEIGAAWAQARFPASVSEPIRLHVAAKRYLCTTEPDYEARLGKDSRISLVLQGGKMSDAEAAAFLAQPYAQDAITLRRLDEAAKDPHAVTPRLEAILDRHLAIAVRAGLQD
jgi:[1-hydroxy-2-(trimethylamino)ethyl]phosphonate dioxygenase